MYLKKSHSNGRIYLSFVQGYRQDGKVKQKTIEKIGYLDELAKVYDDPIEHFNNVVKQRNKEQLATTIEISTTATLSDDTRLRKNLGYAVPKRIYGELDLNKFFQKKQNRLKKLKYNLNHIFSLLVFNRFLEPCSKKKAFENRELFFERADFSLDDIYRALDYFSNYSNEIQQFLNEKVMQSIGRNNSISYYDVTNFYFEIPYNDEDVFDADGNLIKSGFRKKGPSKEHKKTPIIQMGLLMDANGLPVAFNTFPGNESEKTSLLPTIRRVKKDYEMERVIVVADRGLNTSDNIALMAGKNLNSNHNDGYVYGQSVLGADKDFKKWVLDKNGYISSKELDDNGNEISFIHKSRIYPKTVQLKNSSGKRTQKIDTCQKQMVYFSEKYAKKQRKDREIILHRAQDLIVNPGKYNKATSYGATAYIKNIRFSKDTGEIPDGLDLSIDMNKIEEEQKYDGYYSIVTSEVHLSDKEIRDIYRGLWKIEEAFRVIKSEFRARPVYLKLEEHINAHFLVCFVALLIIRILELKLGGKFSASRIRETLRHYGCSHIDQNYYLFDYRDDVLKEIETLFGFDLKKKIMSTSEIKKILHYPK